MSPKRPASIMGDDERAELGREARRTPREGIPAVIADDLTPPPPAPPDITELPGFEDLEPAIREPIIALHNSQRELDVALARVWSARHAADQVVELRLMVQNISNYLGPVSEMLAGWRSQAGLLQRLLERMDAQAKREDRTERDVDAMDKRVDGIEREHTGFNATLTAFGQRIEASVAALVKSIEQVDLRQKELDARQRTLEANAATEADVKAALAEVKALEKAHDERIKSLEETRTRQRGAMWVLGVLAPFLAGVVAFAFKAVWDWARGK